MQDIRESGLTSGDGKLFDSYNIMRLSAQVIIGAYQRSVKFMRRSIQNVDQRLSRSCRRREVELKPFSALPYLRRKRSIRRKAVAITSLFLRRACKRDSFNATVMISSLINPYKLSIPGLPSIDNVSVVPGPFWLKPQTEVHTITVTDGTNPVSIDETTYAPTVTVS